MKEIILQSFQESGTVTPDGVFAAWPSYDDKYTFSKAVIKHYSPLPSWKVYALLKVHYKMGML